MKLKAGTVRESSIRQATITDYAFRLKAISAAPIADLPYRAQRLASLLADIVDAETEGGSLVLGNKYIDFQEWWKQLHVVLEELGFKRLGNGFFGAAYSHPLIPGRVIKVGYKKEDSAAAYVAFCRANAGLEGLPVIHHAQRHKACYTVVMDHLEKFKPGDASTEVEYQCAIAKSVILRDSDYYYDGEVTATTEQEAALKETCERIKSFFDGIARFDLHHENVMIHPKTGNLVVIDPVSYSECDRVSRNPWEGVDFDHLIDEIAGIRDQINIQRCKDRKARHVARPYNRKELRKDRKLVAKAKKASSENQRRWQAQRWQKERNIFRAEVFGHEDHMVNIWRCGGHRAAEEAQRRLGIEHDINDILAVAGHGKLKVDQWIDAQFDRTKPERPVAWGFRLFNVNGQAAERKLLKQL